MQTQMTLNLGIDERVDVRSFIVHGDPKGRVALVALLNCGDFREMCKRDMVRVEAWAASRMGANAKWSLSGTWEHVNLVWRLVEPAMGYRMPTGGRMRALGV